MKYVVMECHPAYAVLMDEASRLVHAANLHYEVGQVVESPVLLRETALRSSGARLHMTVRQAAAAAACIALMAGGSLLYYHGNYQTYSTIVVSAAANVSMDISRSGKVLAVHPLNAEAAALLTDYECRGKDQHTVISELIDLAVSGGYVSAGDTVYIYVDGENAPEDYRTQIAEDIAAYDLNVNVSGYSDPVQTTDTSAALPTDDTSAPTQAAATEASAQEETTDAPETTEMTESTTSSRSSTDESTPDRSGYWGFSGPWLRGWNNSDTGDEETDTTYSGWNRGRNWYSEADDSESSDSSVSETDTGDSSSYADDAEDPTAADSQSETAAADDSEDPFYPNRWRRFYGCTDSTADVLPADDPWEAVPEDAGTEDDTTACS